MWKNRFKESRVAAYRNLWGRGRVKTEQLFILVSGEWCSMLGCLEVPWIQLRMANTCGAPVPVRPLFCNISSHRLWLLMVSCKKEGAVKGLQGTTHPVKTCWCVMPTCNWISRCLLAMYPLSHERGKKNRKHVKGNLNNVLYSFKQHLTHCRSFPSAILDYALSPLLEREKPGSLKNSSGWALW